MTVAPPPGSGSARIRRDSTMSDTEGDVFLEGEDAHKTAESKSRRSTSGSARYGVLLGFGGVPGLDSIMPRSCI